MPQHELHPLCTLFPRVTGAEFDALVADIRTHGLRQPITLHDGMILDGGNRYRACVEAGVDPEFVNFEGGNLVSFVLSANLHRRHMTAGQQAAIVASAQDWGRAHPKGGTGANQHKSRPATLPVSSAPADTVASRAAQSGASERTQRMADKVARESPALARKVAHGEMTLPAAHKEISPAKPANDDHDDGPSLAELVDELQAENSRLTALVAVAEQDDAKAEAIKWRRCYDNAQRQQSEAMDRLSREQKEARRLATTLHAACKAAGVEDPRKLVTEIRRLAGLKAAA